MNKNMECVDRPFVIKANSVKKVTGCILSNGNVWRFSLINEVHTKQNDTLGFLGVAVNTFPLLSAGLSEGVQDMTLVFNGGYSPAATRSTLHRQLLEATRLCT